MADPDLVALNRRLLARAEKLADALGLGIPSSSSTDEFRFRGRGSLRITRTGEHRGRFEDFESGESGDLLALIHSARGGDFKEAISSHTIFSAIPNRSKSTIMNLRRNSGAKLKRLMARPLSDISKRAI
jgi:hypothetical protein